MSRDRRWSLFERGQDSDEFALYATVDKKTSVHARIIWCCAWTHDSRWFVTGSRDGKVVVWERGEGRPENVVGRCKAASQPLELKGESVTAVAFAPQAFAERYLLAVGLESGPVMLYWWSVKEWREVLRLEQR